MFELRAGNIIGRVAMGSLLLLAIFVWQGLMMWAILVFLLAARSIPPLNDVTPLTPGRFALGVLSFVILAAILVPVPQMFAAGGGLSRPYL